MKLLSMKGLILLFAAAALAVTAAWSQSADELPSAPSAVAQPKQTAPPAATPQDKKAEDGSLSDDDLQSLEPPRNTPKAEPAKAAPASSAQPEADPVKNATLGTSSDIPAEGTAETIRRSVNEVNVVFTVTDKRGRFIKNLTQQDIKVIDDRKPVDSIRAFQSQTDLPLRVGLLVDSSNSVRDRFKFEQEAATEFLNQIVRYNRDLAFVLGFDTVSEVTQDFTSDTGKLSHGVATLKPGGGTALYDALFYAARDKLMKHPDKVAIRRAIILLSDGEDNQSRVSRDEAVQMAQRAEVIVYAISTNVSGNVLKGDKVMQYIAESTGGRAFFPFKIQDVANAFSEIQDELRSQYAVAYKPPDFQLDGRYRSIEIAAQSSSNKKLRVRARKGYYAPVQ
jgi:Ca-activated chloride channel family protein